MTKFNFIPSIWTYRVLDGPEKTAVQLNADGTVFVDWDVVQQWAALVPLTYPFDWKAHEGLTMHVLIAIRDGRIVDAPRECWIDDASQNDSAQPMQGEG